MRRAVLTMVLVIPVAAIGLRHQLLSVPDGTPAVQAPASWSLVTVAPVPLSAAVRPGRPSMRGLGWQVVNYLSAHGVLVVTIHTHRMAEATDIAVELVEPLQDGYVEVLVYFHRPKETMATKRIQWSPSLGFVETNFAISTGATGYPDAPARGATPRTPLSKGS